MSHINELPIEAARRQVQQTVRAMLYHGERITLDRLRNEWLGTYPDQFLRDVCESMGVDLQDIPRCKRCGGELRINGSCSACMARTHA
jgi:hypothetical protein